MIRGWIWKLTNNFPPNVSFHCLCSFPNPSTLNCLIKFFHQFKGLQEMQRAHSHFALCRCLLETDNFTLFLFEGEFLCFLNCRKSSISIYNSTKFFDSLKLFMLIFVMIFFYVLFTPLDFNWSFLLCILKNRLLITNWLLKWIFFSMETRFNYLNWHDIRVLYSTKHPLLKYLACLLRKSLYSWMIKVRSGSNFGLEPPVQPFEIWRSGRIRIFKIFRWFWALTISIKVRFLSWTFFFSKVFTWIDNSKSLILILNHKNEESDRNLIWRGLKVSLRSDPYEPVQVWA